MLLILITVNFSNAMLISCTLTGRFGSVHAEEASARLRSKRENSRGDTATALAMPPMVSTCTLVIACRVTLTDFMLFTSSRAFMPRKAACILMAASSLTESVVSTCCWTVSSVKSSVKKTLMLSPKNNVPT